MIIIITEMAVLYVAGYLIEERLLIYEDNISNKFRILKERHIQMRKPYQLPGWTKNSSYYIVLRSGIELNSFIMANGIAVTNRNKYLPIIVYLCTNLN